MVKNLGSSVIKEINNVRKNLLYKSTMETNYMVVSCLVSWIQIDVVGRGVINFRKR